MYDTLADLCHLSFVGINTILDSDRIVVLDLGEVKEFDTPVELIRQKGLFYELVRESGLLGSVDMSGSKQ